MKILNLYAGIGGNRKLWGNDHEIIAVELNTKTANIYRDLYPNDTLIEEDAHEYILDHYEEFDFIWSSPPCQTHSRANYFINSITRSRYPDMGLWQEIIFLNQFFKGKWCVENVIGYYDPLIEPTKIGRHYLWSNFKIPVIEQPKNDIGTMIKGHPNRANKTPLIERNAVNENLGLHILDTAMGIIRSQTINQNELF